MALARLVSAEASRASAEPSRRAVREAVETVVSLLNPMAPHLTEELWERLGYRESLVDAPWPTWDEELAREEVVVIVLQVDGRVRGRLDVPAGLGSEEIVERARDHSGIRRHVGEKRVARVVTVPDRLVNFVLAGR